MEINKAQFELLNEYKKSNDTIGDGYWRFLDADKLKRYVHKYNGGDLENFYPFALSVFGEILVIEMGQHITYIDGATNSVSIISNTIREFLKDVEDDGYMNHFFRIALFKQAKLRHNLPSKDECYSFKQLLQLGGTETVDNITLTSFNDCLSFF